MANKTVREAVGVFQTNLQMRPAVDDLLAVFNRAALSFVGNHKDIEAALGRSYTNVRQIEDHPEMPRSVVPDDDSGAEGKAAIIGGLGYVGAVGAAAVVAAAGAATLPIIAAAAVAAGTAGAFGAIIAGWIGKSHAAELDKHLESGGLLLWVSVQDAAQERKAVEILRRHGASDVHVHEYVRDQTPLNLGMSRDLSDTNRIAV